jgi:8-amino-3,8-dideoxy-alpha-D-manno-octulosonate transaminase
MFRNHSSKVAGKNLTTWHSEDILGRTLVMGISVKMSAEKLNQIKKGIEQAVKNF